MRSTTRETYRQRILRVLVHIQEHLDEPLTLEELARGAHFSPYHFHRIFRGIVGESLGEHVRRVRLDRAAQHLLYTERPVTRIALEAGYETHESFTRAFRAAFGASPSEYRRSGPFGQCAPGRPKARRGQVSLNPYQGEVTVEVEIKNLEPIRVAFVRHMGPYDQCGSAWGTLCGYAGPKGYMRPDTLAIGISYDDPDVTPPEKLRYDACITVGDDFQPAGEVGVQDIAGGDYAVVTHLGPYDGLKETYRKIFREWVPNCGRELRSQPCFEIYRKDPNTTPPEELVTEIYVPLE